MNFFKFFNTSSENGDLPELFPIGVKADAFTKDDIEQTYIKILTDVFESTNGLSKEQEPSLYDNCLQSEAPEGLISLLASAMANMAELYVVYKSGVIRRATKEEQELIRADYKTKTESSNGVYISFKKYRRTEMLKVYSGLEFCVLSSLNKSMNLAKSVQIKISDLRKSVSLNDAEVAKQQGKDIAKGLSNGKDVMLDAADTVEVPKVDMSPTEKAMQFIDAKRAFILSLPTSYISGDQTPGIGSTGEADMRAVERGLKGYFVSIVKPAVKAIFKRDVEFKSKDFRQAASALEALKTFDLVTDDFFPRESKIQTVARMFDIDPEILKKQLAAQGKEKPDPTPTPKPALAAPKDEAAA